MANPRNPGESQADADKRASDDVNKNRSSERQSPQPNQPNQPNQPAKPAPKE